jgi:four helix bundle protein
MPASRLYHEKLDAYQLSIRFVAMAARISDTIPRGHAGLADPLRRAAISIPLNIAEGVGKPRPADRARFHAIARGSAMECSAIIDVVGVLHDNPEAMQPAKQLWVRIVEMLTKMRR